MPSTFTPSLGIELPANGEQDAVWGDIVNDNMSIVDRATDGQTTQALSGTSSTLTVTSTDGQRKVLILSGSPSGTHTLTLSPNTSQKIYFVKNTTAQSVVFTQGSGGNITVAAGDSAILYSNGAGSGAQVFSLSASFPIITANLTVSGTVSFAGATVTDGGSVTTIDINGGTIDGTAIGSTVASTGKFTTVFTDSIVNLADSRGPTLTKGFVEVVYALSGTTPALNPANGTVQTWTLSGASSPTDSVAVGESMTLMIDDGSSNTITWPSVTWKSDGGVAPTLNLSGFTVVVLWKVGSVLYGARVGDA